VCLRLLVPSSLEITHDHFIRKSSNFFDSAHSSGLGIFNRIREVKPRKAMAFLACDIAALNGPSISRSTRRFGRFGIRPAKRKP